MSTDLRAALESDLRRLTVAEQGGTLMAAWARRRPMTARSYTVALTTPEPAPAKAGRVWREGGRWSSSMPIRDLPSLP